VYRKSTGGPETVKYHVVNKPVNRVDGLEKVTGQVKYVGDISFGHQLYAKTVYTKYPHAKIIKIDATKAEALEGVSAVITARDVPACNSMFGRFPVLADKSVKYIGDGVAVVAAETKALAEKAAALVEVEYQELPAIFTVDEGIEGKLKVHEDLSTNVIENTVYPMYMGDVEKGFAEADKIIERSYRTQYADQAYIEPEVIIALPDPYRVGVEIHGSIQNPYSIRENVAKVLGFKLSQVRIVQGTIGGSFGGKDESVMMMAARCAILAMKTKRPVKMVLTREECFTESCKRHASLSHYKIGVKNDGTITAIQDTIYFQGGAYNNKAMFTNWRGSVHAAGAYYCPHIRTDISGIYTNTIYGGAYRGFSAPQIVFANESLMDEVAAELGMDPKAFRLKNCLKANDEIATGQILKPGQIEVPLAEMIEDTCRRAEWDRKRKEFEQHNKNAGAVKKGIGMSITYRGTGLGGEGIDTAGGTVTIDKDGSINIQSNMIEMGQGMRTVHAQIVAETLGVEIGRITFSTSDTSITMDGGPTVASRGTLAGGKAMLLAAQKLKTRMLAVAAEDWKVDPEELEMENEVIFHKNRKDLEIGFDDLIKRCLQGLGISLSAQGWHTPGPEHLDHSTGRGNAYPSYIYGVAVSEISVDTDTGLITVDKVALSYELGRAINPQQVEGQLIGGFMQGIGYGIMEDMECRKGVLLSRNFDDYMIPTSKDIPEFDLKLYEVDDNIGPFGAKGVGEIGIELAAPSIANALKHATGKRVRELPLNLERVLLGRNLSR
jgi:CO/xanthine dehydrogenase Mo-binding subunit